MNEGLDLIKRQQPEIIDGFPTGNIYIGVTKEELTELEKELKDKEKFDNFMKRYNLNSIEELDDFFNQCLNKEIEKCSKCKELKALEIIKEMSNNDKVDRLNANSRRIIKTLFNDLTKEKQDLLKEVGL